MSNNVSASSGIGFFGWLTIALVVLKATGYITLSWFLVFLPIISYFSIWFLIVAGLLFVMYVASSK